MCLSIMDLVPEPGELPLMSNPNAVKQVKSMQDSITSETLPRRSPVLHTSITQEMDILGQLDSFEGVYDNRGDAEEELHVSRGALDGVAKSNRDGAHSHGRRHARGIGTSARSRGLSKSPKMRSQDGRMRSPNVRSLDPRMSWDLGNEVAFSGMEAGTHDDALEEMQGCIRQDGVAFHSHDERTSDWVRASVGEDVNYSASPEMWSWLDFQDPNAMQGHPAFSVHQNEDGTRARAMHWTSQLEQEHKLWRENDKNLTPLILNPHAEMHRSPHACSHFMLEEPFDDEEADSNIIDWQQLVSYQEAEASQAMVGRTSRPSLTPTGPAQHTHHKQTSSIHDNARSPKASLCSGVTGQHYSEYPRLPPSESEFFEYEVEALELPSKKESSRTHQRPKYLSPGKAHSTRGEGVVSLELAKGARRKHGGSIGRPSIMPRRSRPCSHPTGTREVEPLALLTELENYNGTEEFGGTSVDGEHAGLSMSELHGELELVACHGAPDTNNGGRLVKVSDVERLQLSIPECKKLALCDVKPRSLSQKYRPKVFDEVVGQHIVAHALSNALLKGKIAPVYLFQGSRGTGKTSAARIFASGLICIASEGTRPCGVCHECITVAAGKCSEVREVDAASNNGVEQVKALLADTISAPALSRFKVFIIDECHVLTMETWNALLRILEEPPMNVVFILITTDADQLPRTVVSRCQKFPFPKIKDLEIVKRLQKLAELEDLTIDTETLQLIASRSDGSLRDAETILDQVSLLGQQINSSTVYELVGSVSDERMLGLLDSALQADTITTVRVARELIDSGVEPLSLMSRLATLITDILAGSFKLMDTQRKGFFRKQCLSEEKLERLRMAMKTLAEAEKQLRTSNDRTTWLIAALLQLGPDRSFMFPGSFIGTSLTQSPVALDVIDFEYRSSGRQTCTDGDGNIQTQASELAVHDSKSGHSYADEYVNEKAEECKEVSLQEPFKVHSSLIQDEASSELLPHLEAEQLDECITSMSEQRLSSDKLHDVWCKVVQRCQSNTLRRLLYASVKLISISILEVDAVVHLEVCNPDDNASIDRSHKRIANLFETVLGFPVEVKLSLASLPAEMEVSRDSLNGRDDSVPGSADRVGHYGRVNQTCTLRQSTLHQPNTKGPFCAISQGNVASVHQPPPNHALISGESQEISKVLSSMASGSSQGGIKADGVQDQHRVLCNEEKTDYYGTFNKIVRERERHIDEIEMLSPEFIQVEDLHDKAAWPQHTLVQQMQTYNCIDAGRRSFTSDLLQKSRKGSHLNMVRRLSMRSRIQSLPSSDPNSPVPTANVTHEAARLSNVKSSAFQGEEGQQHAVEVSTSETGVGEISATQRKGKLKVAAGGFARFFQGRLTKQGME